MAFVLVELIVEAVEAALVAGAAGAEVAVTTIAEVTGASELATAAQASYALASSDLAVAGAEALGALGVTTAAVVALGKPKKREQRSTPDGMETQKVLPAEGPKPPAKAGAGGAGVVEQECYVPMGWSRPARRRKPPVVSKRDLEVAVAALLLSAAQRR